MSIRREREAEQRLADDPDLHYHILTTRQQLFIVRRSHVWQPPTDVVEADDRLIVIVEIAGMQDGEFHVAVSPQRLTISGIRPAVSLTCTAYHQLEVRYGEFRTDITLPWPVDEEHIVARYEDGFLRVDLPRAQPQRVRLITVDKTGIPGDDSD